MTDILETARWVAEGRLAPWAVSDESVVEMARKLLEAVEACEAMQEAANEERRQQLARVARVVEVMQEPTSETECRARIEAEREACAQAEAKLRDMERKAAHWSEALRMAVEAERAACARVAVAEEAVWRKLENSDVLPGDKWQHRQQAQTAWDIAKAIRARGGK